MNSLRTTMAGIERRLRQLRAYLLSRTLSICAHIVTAVRPPRRWYWDVRWMAISLAGTIRMLRPGMSDPSLEARLLHRFLDVLSEGGRRYPIPTRVEGLEILQAAAAGTSGFVCCTAHVPLVKAFIPTVRQALQPGAELVATVKYPREDGHVDVWADEPLRAIATGYGVLLQTRSLLRRGGCLLMLADKEQGEYISSNIFRFVGKVKSHVIMGFPHLMPDGVILLKIVEAPAPQCLNEVEIRANLDFIAQNVRAILAGDAPPEKIRPNVMPLAQIHVAERGREIDRVQLYSRTQLLARTRRLEQVLEDPSTQIADRTLYEKRLKLLHNELELRSRILTRTEFGPDGRPLGPDGKPLPPRRA